MAQAPAVRVRVSGAILLICSAVLGGMGVWLMYIALNWVWPVWVPTQYTLTPRGPVLPFAALRDSQIGLAAGYLLVFAFVASLNGLWNLWFGRRNWVLMVPLLLLFAIFVVVGARATMLTSSGA
jgi:hypothetical protein